MDSSSSFFSLFHSQMYHVFGKGEYLGADGGLGELEELCSRSQQAGQALGKANLEPGALLMAVRVMTQAGPGGDHSALCCC